jgi:hypothetical protein
LRKNFVPIKSLEQQGAQMLARVRTQFIGRRTQLANSIRGYAAEFGFTAPKGLSRLQQLLIDIRDDTTVPSLEKELVEALAIKLARVHDQIAKLDKKLMQLHRSNEMSRRLAAIPGWSDRRDAAVNQGRGCTRVQVGKKLRCLAWPDTKELLDGWKEPPRRDYARRRRNVANRLGGRRDSCDRRYAPTGRSLLALAQRYHRTQAAEAGGHSVGK